jgi:hypothetical protein
MDLVRLFPMINFEILNLFCHAQGGHAHNTKMQNAAQIACNNDLYTELDESVKMAGLT